MTNQQPECPADRVFPCPRCNGDGCFRCGDSGIANEADDYRARLEEAEARVKELESENHRLKVIPEALERMNADLKLNLQSARRKVDRLDKVESQLARVKALLDGVGPVVDRANRLVSAIDNDSMNCYCDDIEDEIICPFTKFVRQVQEVLKGE